MDSTIAFPLFCEYAVGHKNGRRKLKKLVHQRDALLAALKDEAIKARKPVKKAKPARKRKAVLTRS